MQEETRQKLAFQTKLRDANEEANRLQEQLEEEEDEKKCVTKSFVASSNSGLDLLCTLCGSIVALYGTLIALFGLLTTSFFSPMLSIFLLLYAIVRIEYMCL